MLLLCVLTVIYEIKTTCLVENQNIWVGT